MTYCHETPNCHKNAGIDLCFPVDGLQKKTWSFSATGKKIKKAALKYTRNNFFRKCLTRTKIILVSQ